MMEYFYQALAWLEIKASATSRLPVTIPVAFVAVILCFFMVPSTRKLSLFGPALIGVSLVGYLVNELGISYNWSQGLTVTIAAFAGFFTLAGLIVFAKVHEKLLVDDRIVDAVISLLMAAIKRAKGFIGGNNDKSA